MSEGTTMREWLRQMLLLAWVVGAGAIGLLVLESSLSLTNSPLLAEIAAAVVVLPLLLPLLPWLQRDSR
jgi:hypothetical protein